MKEVKQVKIEVTDEEWKHLKKEAIMRSISVQKLLGNLITVFVKEIDK